MSATGNGQGGDYDNVAVCTKDPHWRLERWEDLTPDILPGTHLAKADQLLVRRGAERNLGPGWEPDDTYRGVTAYGGVTVYRRTEPDAVEPPSGVPVMREVNPSAGVEPNIIYCTQGLRDRGSEPEGVSFRVAPRYQGVWAVEAEPLSEGDAAAAEAAAVPRADERLTSQEGEGRAPVEIGIVDTGIAQGPFLGEFLERTIAPQWLVNSASSDLPDPDGNRRIESPAGHGTFVSGVIAQIEANVRIHIIRAVGRYGAVSDVALAQAIDELVAAVGATGTELDILNLSLGAWTYDDRQPLLVGDRIAQLSGRTLVVAAAGNLESQRKFWPAAIGRVVSVGAVIEDDGYWEPAEYSNYGEWVNAVAPDGARRIPGGKPSEGGQDSTYFANFPPGEETSRYNGWARWRGTSFTAPTVVGRIAKTMVDDNLMTAQEAWQRVRDTSERAPSYKFPNAVVVTPYDAETSASTPASSRRTGKPSATA